MTGNLLSLSFDYTDKLGADTQYTNINFFYYSYLLYFEETFKILELIKQLYDESFNDYYRHRSESRANAWYLSDWK